MGLLPLSHKGISWLLISDPTCCADVAHPAFEKGFLTKDAISNTFINYVIWYRNLNKNAETVHFLGEHTHTHTHTHTTHTETHRETDGHTHRDRQTDRQTHTHTYTHTLEKVFSHKVQGRLQQNLYAALFSALLPRDVVKSPTI